MQHPTSTYWCRDPLWSPPEYIELYDHISGNTGPVEEQNTNKDEARKLGKESDKKKKKEGTPSHSNIFCFTQGFCFLGMGLAKHHVAVKHRLPLFLDLPPPALLSVLHFVQHVGARGRTRQYVVGVGERLLVLNPKRDRHYSEEDSEIVTS